MILLRRCDYSFLIFTFTYEERVCLLQGSYYTVIKCVNTPAITTKKLLKKFYVYKYGFIFNQSWIKDKVIGKIKEGKYANNKVILICYVYCENINEKRRATYGGLKGYY